MTDTVAVLGGGNGAHATAVDLASRGWAVNMFELPEFTGVSDPYEAPGNPEVRIDTLHIL